MNVIALAALLQARAALRRHERWTRQELEAHQTRDARKLSAAPGAAALIADVDDLLAENTARAG